MERYIGSDKVKEIIMQLIQEYCSSAFIKSDNGTEFIRRLLSEWLKEQEIKTLYIVPGSPWQKGNVWGGKSFIRSGNVVSSWKIGYGSITIKGYIEARGRAHQMSMRNNSTERKRFILRSGLRPPLPKHLAGQPYQDIKVKSAHSTWARKPTAGKLLGVFLSIHHQVKPNIPESCRKAPAESSLQLAFTQWNTPINNHCGYIVEGITTETVRESDKSLYERFHDLLARVSLKTRG